MSIQIKSIFIILSFFIFLFISIPALRLLKKINNFKAKIVTDKLSIFSICIVAFIYVGYQIDFIIEINLFNNMQSTMFMIAFAFLGYALYLLLSQNIFSFTDDLFIIYNKNIKRSQIRIRSIKPTFTGRILVKAFCDDREHVENHQLFRLTKNNYDKYGTIFNNS